jgi:hypothetical protein
MRVTWARVRVIWATLGVSATLILIIWSAVAYRASASAFQALVSSDQVKVSEFPDHWLFLPTGQRPTNQTGLLFFPGAMVDPVAYAPLARVAAEAGHVSLLIRVPRRGILGGAEEPGLIPRSRDLLMGHPNVKRWLVAGHSRGGEIAARFAREQPGAVGALLLIATSHPRDFSLAQASFKVTHLSASRDGYATPRKVAANRGNLPGDAQLIVIEGGNHSQFGWYGFQPGDRFAAISREEQQKRTLDILLACLAGVEPAPVGVPR